MYSPALAPINLVVFRLEDVCVRIQEDLRNFPRTAALEKQPEVETIFRWLHRRGVRIVLLADAEREDAVTILGRLGWAVGEEELVQRLVAEQQVIADPVRRMLDLEGLERGDGVCCVFDTPRLLRLAAANKLCVKLGVLNGSHAYGELVGAPADQLLDQLVQLPNYLLERVPELSYLAPLPNPAPASAPASSATTRRLQFLPRSLNGYLNDREIQMVNRLRGFRH